MGTLADLVVGAEGDAQSIVESEYPLGDFAGVNVDGLDPLQLAALHSMLTGQSSEQVLAGYQPIASASPAGPWLIRLPVQLIEELPNVAPQDQAEVAAKWAALPDVVQQGWTQQEAEAYLARLIHFARTVAFEGKRLYLCAYD